MDPAMSVKASKSDKGSIMIGGESAYVMLKDNSSDPSSTTEKQSHASEMISDSTVKRKYGRVSDEDRLKMVLLIKKFGMSCRKAAKVMNIPYNNAKVIYQIYSRENRIK